MKTGSFSWALSGLIGVCLCCAIAVTQQPIIEAQSRQELEAALAQRTAATNNGEREKANSFLAPDFTAKLPNGKTLARQEAEALATREGGRSHYREEFAIEKLELKTDTARVDVRRTASFQQKFKDGTIGEITTTGRQRETWVRTPQGWKLRLIDEMKPGETKLSGKKLSAKESSKVVVAMAAQDDPVQPASPEDRSVLQEGKAIVLIYRERDYALLHSPPVYVNGQKIASLKHGRYVKLKLEPGAYQLKSEKEPELSAIFAAGQIYYFQMRLASGLPKARGYLETAASLIGSQIYLAPQTFKLEPVAADEIEDSSKIISSKPKNP